MSEVDFVKNSEQSSNLVNIGLHLPNANEGLSINDSSLHVTTSLPRQDAEPTRGQDIDKRFLNSNASKISPKSKVWQNSQTHLLSPAPHTPSDAPTAPVSSESTPAEECERAELNQLEVTQERLLLLIHFHGPSGILSSDLPRVYQETFKERLDMLDEGGEKRTVKDLLSHPCIAVIMNRGGQPRYVYDKSGQAAMAPILPTFPLCLSGDNNGIDNMTLQLISEHKGARPTISPTLGDTEQGLGPVRLHIPSSLNQISDYSSTVLSANSSCPSSTTNSSQHLNPPFRSSPATPNPSLPTFIPAINSTLSTSPVTVPTPGASMNPVAGGLFLNSSHLPRNGASNTNFFGTSENITKCFHQPDSIFFNGLASETALNSNMAIGTLGSASAVNIGGVHDTQNVFMAQESIIAGSSTTLGSSGITANGGLIRDFDFESNGSPFQQRAIDFGSFMGGLLTTPSPFLNGSPPAGATNSSPVLDFTNGNVATNGGSSGDFVTSKGLPLTGHGGDRINLGGAINSTGNGNIAGGASAAPGPVGGTRRRGPSISNPGSTGSIGSLTLEVSVALENAFGPGSPTNKPATIPGLGALPMPVPTNFSGGGMTGSGLLLSDTDNISATDLSEHRYAQVCANNQLLQSQVLSLQNDLIGKSRELDLQGQHLMEAMHLLQKSEDRFHAVNAEKEKTLTQWRHKTSELIESESKLRMKNDELNSIREVLKDRESALSRSELTKNSLIPELKQLRNRISQMEAELDEARKRNTEFERVKTSLTQEIESLRNNQNYSNKSQLSPCSGSSNGQSLSQSPRSKTPQPIEFSPINSSQVQISSSPSMSLYEFKPAGPGPISTVPSATPMSTAIPGSVSAIAWDNDRARVALQAEVDSLRAQLNDLRRSMGSFQEYFPAANANSAASRPNASNSVSAPTSALPATKAVTVTLSSSPNSPYRHGDPNNSGGHYSEESYKPVIKCSLSGCEQNGLHICTGCNSVGYCGLEHQKEHWKIHGKFCAGKK